MVSNIIVHLQGRPLQYFAFFSGALSILSCGLHLGWPAPYLPQLLNNDSPIPMTNDEGSWIAVSFLIGGICGSASSSLLLDKFGRKKLIILSNIPFLISWLTIAFASTIVELCLARFIAGLSDGVLFCSVPLYFAEMADPKVRGLFLSGITFMQLFGVLAISVLGVFLSIKVTAFIGVLLLGIVLFTFIWLPETPHYYVVKGKLDKAKNSLQKFSAKSEVDHQIDQTLKTVADSNNSKGKLANLFMNKNSRKAVCIMLVLRLVQQWSGITGFIFYLPTILKNAEDFVSPLTSTCIYYTLQMAAAFMSMMTIDKIGRKPLLIFSVAIVTLSLSTVGFYFAFQNLSSFDLSSYSWIPLIGLFFFIFGYSSGLQSIPLLLVGEIFPIRVKVLAVSLFDVYYCIMSTITSKFFQFTKDEFGLHVPFLTYAIICMCGLPFVIYFVSETKEKTLEEIQNKFKSKDKV